MKPLATLCLIMLSILTWLPAKAANNITEIVIASEEWEDATNKDGTGLYWDIFRAVYEPENIQVKTEIRSYAGSVEMVKQQKADAMVGAYKDEVDDALFPQYHFDADVVQAVFKKGKVAEFKGQESLSGKKVAWIKGYGYDEYLDVPVSKNEFDRRADIIRVLGRDRVDFFLEAKAEIVDCIEKGLIDPASYEIVTVLKLNLYLAFTNNARGQRLKEIFDTRFPQLVASGEIKRLYAKWDMADSYVF